MYTWVHAVNLLILAAYVAAFVMLIICTVSLVRILRVLRPRRASGIEVIPNGGDEPAPYGFAGVDPQVVAAIAAAVAVSVLSEVKILVVRSVRLSGGLADAGRRESGN